MKLPGHLPNLARISNTGSKHVQSLPQKERENLERLAKALTDVSVSQDIVNRRVLDILEELVTNADADSSSLGDGWARHFMVMGG